MMNFLRDIVRVEKLLDSVYDTSRVRLSMRCSGLFESTSDDLMASK